MASAADLSAHMQNWLARVGFPVQASQFAYSSDPSMTGGYATPGAVYVSQRKRKSLNSVAARWGKRGALDDNQIEALRILLHENLHQMRYGRTPDFYQGHAPGTAGGYEEAATEAVTQDLLPIFTAKMYGARLPNAQLRTALQGTDYPGQTKNIRQLSVFGSNAKNYMARPARVWRRTFLHSDPDERMRMVNEATAARVQWGKR